MNGPFVVMVNSNIILSMTDADDVLLPDSSMVQDGVASRKALSPLVPPSQP